MNIILPMDHTSADAPEATGRFVFLGPGGAICSEGQHMQVEAGLADTLERRLATALRDAGPDAVIGGAMPFRRDQPDHLWRATRAASPPVFHATGASMRNPAARPVPVPSPDDYANAVARAEHLLRQEAGQDQGLRKIVLARSLLVSTVQDIRPDTILARLAEDDSVTTFHVSLPDNYGQPRSLLGATPELLLKKRGAAVLSHPLAGSLRRSQDMVEDADNAAALARSDKDRREHALVVEFILDTLAPLCRQLDCPEGTRLTSTRSMWHLGTRICGQLRDDSTPAPVLAAHLHPTPAVCGVPCAAAARQIAQLEPVDRGFYAGAVGWCDQRGDGAWYVAIRCAEICGSKARLFAGAGIVEGSDPCAETAETASKFAAMLHALGLPGDAA